MIIKFVKQDFAKAKKEAKNIIKKGFDVSVIISDIKKIRAKIESNNLVISEKDILQHLTIKIYKERYAI